MKQELPEGVIEKTFYGCEICGEFYMNQKKAKNCFDEGTDYINLPKGFVFGFYLIDKPQNKQNLGFLILNDNQTENLNGNKLHESLFRWYWVRKAMNSNFIYNSEDLILPNSSSELREMLHNKKKIKYVKPLTGEQFEYFLNAANKVRYRNEENNIEDLTKRYNLIHRHKELTRILKEEEIDLIN